MSPKIKMTDSYDKHDEDIIELTEDELKEILADDDFDNEGEYEEIRSPHFSNPNPYFKVEPRLANAPKRDIAFDDKGNIVVKNPSAFWLPEITITEDIGGTEFTITGSYTGSEPLHTKLNCIMQHQAANDETGITEDDE